MQKITKLTLVCIMTALTVFLWKPIHNEARPLNWDWTQGETVGHNHVRSGGYVILVQRMLHSAGYGSLTGTVDGLYGQNTKSGIKRFQRDNNLAADGVVGSQTWSEFRNDVIWISTASDNSYMLYRYDPAGRKYNELIWQRNCSPRHWMTFDTSSSSNWYKVDRGFRNKGTPGSCSYTQTTRYARSSTSGGSAVEAPDTEAPDADMGDTSLTEELEIKTHRGLSAVREHAPFEVELFDTADSEWTRKYTELYDRTLQDEDLTTSVTTEYEDGENWLKVVQMENHGVPKEEGGFEKIDLGSYEAYRFGDRQLYVVEEESIILLHGNMDITELQQEAAKLLDIDPDGTSDTDQNAGKDQ